MKGDQSMSNLLLGLTGVKKFVRKARTSSANRRMKEEASSVGCVGIFELRLAHFLPPKMSSLLVVYCSSTLIQYLLTCILLLEKIFVL